MRLNNWNSSKLAKQLILKFSKISDIIFFTNEDLKNLKISNYKKLILDYYKNKIVIFRYGNGNISIYNKIKYFNYKLKFEKKTESYTYKEEPIVNESDQDEIDLILDKISKSGYSSLTKKEKEKLFKLSKK